MSQSSKAVVLCVDTSDFSIHMAEWYLDFFYRPEHQIHLVHVLEWWGDVARMMSPQRIHEVVKETDLKADELGKKFKKFFEDKGVKDVAFHKLHGKEIWHLILEFADKVNAHVILIGSRGMGTLRRTLLGSTSDAVVHHSRIPVVVCKYKK